MDDADLADRHNEINLAQAMRESLQPLGPLPNGRCHYCDEVVGDEDRWCNAVCRDDWAKELSRGGYK
jgi:hypothetical protein